MIKIIIAIAIFSILSLSANQKLKQECKDERMSSCLELGILYYTGDGVKKDIKKSRKLFYKACKKRISKACGYLGYVYLRGGDGVKVDKRKAMLAFSKGCDISEHDAYCFKYYELRDEGWDYAK
ncbi:MAG: sel1 repeat family protein [Campylobacterota bacterium]